jgi:hypothetical protein
MTVDIISIITQVVSLLLVSGSLIFVGMQMRQTHAIERANAQRHLITQWQEWLGIPGQDTSMFEDVRACMHDYPGSPAFKRQRFFSWAFHALWISEQGLYQANDRLINKASFNRMVSATLAIMATPGGRQWWEEAKLLVGDDIREYLERQLAGGGDDLPPPFYELATHFKAPDAQDAPAIAPSPEPEVPA